MYIVGKVGKDPLLLTIIEKHINTMTQKHKKTSSNPITL